ncbi:MAG: TM2 domain-containing protein [Treponema sp.]|nr:TM2 domain-containing protein [Treponema sp.]
MFCRYCGKEIGEEANFCPACGAAQSVIKEGHVKSIIEQQPPTENAVSPKSRSTTLLLAFFLGIFGIHRFYVGKIGTGILQLLLSTTIVFSTFAIMLIQGSIIVFVWPLIDFLVILFGNFKDGKNRLVKIWTIKY